MGLFGFDVEPAKKKKRRQLTAAEKVFAWENFPHTCHVCSKEVANLSDAEWDHARAYSRGGATNLSNVKITHRLCNRLKGGKTLAQARRHLGLKAPKPAKKRKPKARSTGPDLGDPFGFGRIFEW